VFPVNGQRVPIGELTIFGTSTDDATADCHVYMDWNDLKPFQSVWGWQLDLMEETIIQPRHLVIQRIIIWL
jgi:hypothetical protein